MQYEKKHDQKEDSEQVEELLQEALEAIEEKQDSFRIDGDLDLFTLMEKEFSETDSNQETLKNTSCSSGRKTTFTLDQLNYNATLMDQGDDMDRFYNEEDEAFQADSIYPTRNPKQSRDIALSTQSEKIGQPFSTFALSQVGVTRRIFSPHFSDPLLSSGIPLLATRANIEKNNNKRKSSPVKSSQLRLTSYIPQYCHMYLFIVIMQVFSSQTISTLMSTEQKDQSNEGE